MYVQFIIQWRIRMSQYCSIDNNFTAKEDPEEMQFVLMMYGSAVLVTELQRE